ncbi:MAG: hypothetical protein HY046_05395 [Acidobacteria bacterium]|nr:hypothetical protein [Acidobacteriota bacterium]
MTAKKKYGGNTMTGKLRRVAVCAPKAAGWLVRKQVALWDALGYRSKPVFAAAHAQHDAMCKELELAGADLTMLPEAKEFSLDAIYCHDASLMTDWGAIVLRMGKDLRREEPAQHASLYKELGIPVLGEIREPGTVEGGDVVWLDGKTLLVGRGYRTNADGIEQLQGMLAPKGVDVIAAPLPHGGGPKTCLHLMSLISLLDEDAAVVDSTFLAVETVELLTARGFRFVEIDPTERDTLACNVLSLGGGKLLALAENPKTNHLLREAGFDVRTFSGTELALNGAGGPTCLTRPILRD